MSPTFISRLHVLVTVVAVLGMMLATALVTPATARGASAAQCSIQRAGAGDPAALRVRCVAKRPSAAGTLGTSIPRRAMTCTIAHLGALDPAAFRLVC